MSTSEYIQTHLTNNNFSNTAIINILNYEEKSSSDLDNNFEYWPIETRVTMSILFASLSIIGIIGNLLVVTVVHRVPGMITPTNCYLVSLAISDCMFFVAAAPTELSYLHVSSSKYIFGHFGCAIFSYLPYLAINTSSMSITAFTIERFIGICYPLRARYICTVKRAKSILFLIWVFGIFYNSPWLYLATLKEDMQGQICSFKLPRDNWTYKVMFLGDFAAFYFIPMILSIYIYAKITYSLSKKSLKSADVNSGSPETIAKNFHLLTGYDVSPKNSANSFREYFVNAGNRKNSTRGNIQVIKMLSVVVFIFAFCWLPYRAMVVYNSFKSSLSRWDPDWYIFLSKALIFFNCSVNPILYNLMSSRFRNAFKRLLNKRKCLDSSINKGKSVTILTRLFNQQSKNGSNLTRRSLSHENMIQSCKPRSKIINHEKCVKNTSLPLKKDVESVTLLNYKAY